MTKVYWFLGNEQFQPEVLLEHARAAETAGFDGVMMSEHFQPWVDDVGSAGFAFSTLGAIAAATTKLQMVTGVTTPLWRFHPAVVAQAAATLSRLSGGRFALGVGTGEHLNEGVLGYNYPNYAERSARMHEALTIMSGLLRGESVALTGQFYQVKGAKLYSPPLAQVPIYLAADGPKSAGLAGEMADGVITSVKDPAVTQEKVIGPSMAAAQAAQRPKPTVIATHWSVRGYNDDEAWTALAAWRGLRAPSRATATSPTQLRQEADALPQAEILARYTRVESAEDYINEYGKVITALHPDILVIQTTSLDQMKTIAMIGREVLPNLRFGVSREGLDRQPPRDTG